MKIINDMEGRIPIKYAVLTIVLGTLLAIAGIMNFYNTYPPIPICY